MTRLPPGSLLREPSTVRLRATADVLRAFSDLTGDRSSLHLDEAFARRSAYRRPVVHGMLPLCFCPLLGPLRAPGLRSVLRGLKARFLAPAFPGETLLLCSGEGRVSDAADELELPYRVQRETSAEVVTEGALTFSYCDPEGPSEFEGGAIPTSLLAEPVPLNSFLFEDVEVGLEDSIAFSVTAGAIESYLVLLAGGLGGGGEPQARTLPGSCYLPNLLPLLLSSTSVGVCLPGASATFLELSARVLHDIQYGHGYRFTARVTHRSRATRVVKKAVTITSEDREGQPFVEGRASALVNPPARGMPRIEEIRDVALDSGLRGKSVVVTGASRGIGETTAKLFALHGARVVVNYLQGADDAARVVEEIRAAGGEAIAVQADVTDEDAVQRLFRQAVEAFGGVGVLVNNAARDFRPIPFLRLRWDEVLGDLEVMVKGAFLCCQAAIPLMMEGGGGSIVNVSSVATDAPPPDQTKYVVAKSALNGLTRSLAVELAPRKIRVNSVVPHFVETDLVAHIPEGFRKKIAADIPAGRLASPVDVARAVVFLASGQASYTTGQRILLTGGALPLL